MEPRIQYAKAGQASDLINTGNLAVVETLRRRTSCGANSPAGRISG